MTEEQDEKEGDASPGSGSPGKALGYAGLVPQAVMLALKMVYLFIGVKRAMKASRKWFRQGLIEAGMDEEEADEIARLCFNGRD
jgi:hypothetical protein